MMVRSVLLVLVLVATAAYSFQPRAFGLAKSKILKNIQSPLFMSDKKEQEGLDLDLEQMFEGIQCKCCVVLYWHPLILLFRLNFNSFPVPSSNKTLLLLSYDNLFTCIYGTVFEAAEKGDGDIGDIKLSTSEERDERQLGEISSTMRDKMLKEAASNDPNFSAGPVAGNPILIISAIIGVLVIVGGKGYFY